MPYSRSVKEMYLDQYVPKIGEKYVSRSIRELSQCTDEDKDDGDDDSELSIHSYIS